jgi:hypothetical protein
MTEARQKRGCGQGGWGGRFGVGAQAGAWAALTETPSRSNICCVTIPGRTDGP